MIPRQLKSSKIIPLFKSGDHSSMDNYRPIALLSTYSKIFEKILGLGMVTDTRGEKSDFLNFKTSTKKVNYENFKKKSLKYW